MVYLHVCKLVYFIFSVNLFYCCSGSGGNTIEFSKSAYPLVKRTTHRGIVCPVFRDEEGFLSEFVAFYQLHGLDHIRFFNDGSTDNSLVELEPWIRSGFVSVVSNTSKLLSDILAKNKNKDAHNHIKWSQMLKQTGVRNTIQRLSEYECKMFAIRNSFDFFFSLDVDEYMFPAEEGMTLMDAVSSTSRETQKSIISIFKYNFAATPHLLEPVDMLTIEAYKVRMADRSKLTYFKTVAPKLILHLTHPNTTKLQQRFMINCCNMHNCKDKNCLHYRDSDTEYLYFGNGRKANEKFNIMMFHYSRSLEKFTLKQKTWQKIGSNNFTIVNFLNRNIGTIFDDRASVRYGWLVRQILYNMTTTTTAAMPAIENQPESFTQGLKSPAFIRPGRFWRLKKQINIGNTAHQ